jgi:uncharacterized membrane protein YdbT with pleckstrin-like domain
MHTSDTFSKLLNSGEKIKHEFTVSKQYRNYIMGEYLVILGLFTSLLLWLFSEYAFSLNFPIITILVSILYPHVYLKLAHSYAFTNQRVLARDGLFATKTTSVEYDKITDVSVRESFIERMFTHTGTVLINTAGSASHEVKLRNVDDPYRVKKMIDQAQGLSK